MAVQVSQIQPKRPKQQQISVDRNPIGEILTLGGAALGGALGSVAGGVGAIPGAAAGASLGQMVGGVVAPPTVNRVDVQEPSQGPQTVSTGNSALSRRLDQIGQSDQNLQQIAASIDSLKYIQDEDLRYKFAQPLVAADFAALKEQGKV